MPIPARSAISRDFYSNKNYKTVIFGFAVCHLQRERVRYTLRWEWLLDFGFNELTGSGIDGVQASAK